MFIIAVHLWVSALLIPQRARLPRGQEEWVEGREYPVRPAQTWASARFR